MTAMEPIVTPRESGSSDTIQITARGVWEKIFLAVVPMVVTGLILIVSLFGRMDATEQKVEGKADREVVQTQNAAILRRLDEIKQEMLIQNALIQQDLRDLRAATGAGARR